MSKNNKKKQRVLIDLPFYDIPKDKLFEAIEVEGVEQLREEFENEIKRKEHEARMKLKAEQEKIEKQNEIAKKQKEIEFKRIVWTKEDTKNEYEKQILAKDLDK